MELKAFLAAIATDWVALMSGIASVVLTILGALRRREIQRWELLIAAVLCFFFASLRVWTAEHKRAEICQSQMDAQTKPQFTARIDSVTVGNIASALIPSTPPFAVLIISIRNAGAPSIAEKYTLNMKLTNGKTVEGILYKLHDQTTFQVGNPPQTATVYRKDSLDDKTSVPIAHNGMARGVLLWVFPNVDLSVLHTPGVEITVGFSDINGAQYSTTISYDGKTENDVLSFPGMEPLLPQSP